MNNITNDHSPNYRAGHKAKCSIGVLMDLWAWTNVVIVSISLQVPCMEKESKDGRRKKQISFMLFFSFGKDDLKERNNIHNNRIHGLGEALV